MLILLIATSLAGCGNKADDKSDTNKNNASQSQGNNNSQNNSANENSTTNNNDTEKNNAGTNIDKPNSDTENNDVTEYVVETESPLPQHGQEVEIEFDDFI